jgi:gingipain R
VRGVDVEVAPVVVNPGAGTVKLLEKIQFELRPIANTEGRGTNIVPEDRPSILRENLSLYDTLFPNFRWDHEISDRAGDVLVIHTPRDVDPVAKYARFRRQEGFKVHTRQVARGTDVQNIIRDEYAANPKIMYVLLVGDWEDIQGARHGRDPADTAMGMVAGNDNYVDVAIGRLSAENAEQVTTQVDKTIKYENAPRQPWHASVLGIGSAEGMGKGDDGEGDKQHMDTILEKKFKPNGYERLYKVYDPGATAAPVSRAINEGVGMVFYTGHGSEERFVTSGFGVRDVQNATNGDKTPIVISVACVNGNFDARSCLAEALQRKKGGGSVATLMSTINQSWIPPMIGQDYIADMLTNGYDYDKNPGNGTSTGHGKARLGSAIFTAMNLWCAESGTVDDVKNIKTWHLFGDPALKVKKPR